ncbi:hypothetical protein FKM82_022456 [Ascaphus truei]
MASSGVEFNVSDEYVGHHDADGKYLLRVGVGRHVSEAHTGQAAEGEVEGGHILVVDGGPRLQVTAVVWFHDLGAQGVEPANGTIVLVIVLHVTNGVPDAGQPVSDEGKGAHEEEEHSRSIL